ncbi:MAG TPA: hypothetical protein ENI76_05440 [Ignavibacteria bacterium]|nr:hypothetical protein [Ignavibacteria bacterium]
MSNIITLSLTKEDKEFLLNNSGLSPTSMLRSKINEVRESRSDLKKQLNLCQNNSLKLNSIIREQGSEIEELKKKLKNEN